MDSWVHQLGLDPSNDGTRTLRRTKATLIYRRTKNLRAVQLLLGHSKLESTVRYLGIGVDDALEIAEQTELRLKGTGAPVGGHDSRQMRSFNEQLSQRNGDGPTRADRPPNATKRNNMSPDMTPTGVR